MDNPTSASHEQFSLSVAIITTTLLLVATAILITVKGVSAHSFIQYIDAGGVRYCAYDPGFRFQSPAPGVPGWYADNPDIGFVPPSSFKNSDIICHKSAKPGQDYVQPRGPIFDYLAPCPASGCTTVSKEDLKFVKVAQAGLKRGVTPATDWLKAWVTDDLIKDNFKWTFQVPEDLKSGMYVLRHETIALHSAWDVEGVQAYPQCINLKVTDGGSTEITEGKSATTFYTQGEPSLHINVYNGFNEGGYPFPGPTLWR